MGLLFPRRATLQNLLLWIFLFPLALALFIYIYAQMFYPILYGLPVSIGWYSRGVVRGRFVWLQLTAPLFWTLGLLATGFFGAAWFGPELVYALASHPILLWASLAALVLTLLQLLTQNGRAGMRKDLAERAQRHLTPSAEPMFRADEGPGGRIGK